MKLRSLSAAFAYRRLLRSIASIDQRLAEQNRYLARLADHFAPQIPQEDAPASAAVDYLNPFEAAVVDDYVRRTQQDTGRPPTDEEVLRYLADEKTIDLQSRLAEGDR